jgi:D-alanyl-D-alanine carboxypeptidase/D-alanyl-D-alanine-endopeptidase (penicillin-binding protein 4)
MLHFLFARRWAWAALLGVFCLPAWANGPLPPAALAALQRAKVPPEALSVLVVEAEGRQPPRLAWRADVPSNPASVMKLVTT